jgi:dTMP kinase
MSRGALIAVEGIDGAGKTTQARHLRVSLQRLGFEVLLEKEPTDGPHGRRLRESARTGRLDAEAELALFLDDRRDHVRDVIEPALARGAVVVVDRYTLSTIAYQGARGLDPAAILRQNDAFAPRPDRVILLDLPPELGVARVRSRDTVENAFERLDDLRRCRAIFVTLPELLGGVRVFDADVPEDELRRQILQDVVCHPLREALAARGLPSEALGCDVPPSAAWEARLWRGRPLRERVPGG